ncbi:MAG: PorV/PorQ family protein [Bacteroidota bacterium]|nr:PorV/PorQ family protein [Bacteroidota bacterium]
MKNLITIILLVTCSVLMYAGDPSRKGTTGAEQLLIPVGASGIATAGAFVSNMVGIDAIYYNPAGLSHLKGSEATFSYMSYLADINISYFAVGTNLGEVGSLGFSLKSFSFGDIPVTTFDSPDGDGSTYSPSLMTIGLTYGKIITDRVSIGVTGKVINENIMDVSATGFALDFGVQYRFPSNLSIGAAVKNIGTNMKYSGQNLRYKSGLPESQPGSKDASWEAVTEEFQIPSYFELSTAYAYNIDEENFVQVGGVFRNNNQSEDQMKFGLEYGFMNMFYVRGGYDMLLKNSDQSIRGFSAGAGVNYSTGGIGMTFDYAYQAIKDFPKPTHTFSLKLALQ